MKIGTDVQPLNKLFAEDLERFAFKKNELHALLRQRSVKYGEYVLHAEMAPLVLEKKELESFRKDAELVLAAAELFSREALKNEKWLKDCLPDPRMRKLAKIDPGYELFIPCARFDTFPYQSGPVMIELNTDGCSGMSNLDTCQSLYTELIVRQFMPKSGLGTEEILPHLLETLLACYRSFAKKFPRSGKAWPKKPTIAIVDWQEEETAWEFYACSEFFRSKGIRALVASPGQLKFDGKTVTAAGEEVHLIYRRLLGEDWGKRFGELKALSGAFSEHKVCVVGSPRSQIAFSKKLFAYLRAPEMLRLYDKATKEAVLRTVPWTIPLRKKMPAAEYQGKMIDPLPFILKNKDLFVLKPCVSKCGFGILQGIHTKEAAWKKGVQAALEEDFVIQEFVPLRTALFPSHGHVREEEKRYLHAGVYLFGGKFSGFFGRTCKDPLLTLRHGERMLPILWKKK